MRLNYIDINNKKHFYDLIQKSTKIITSISIPLIACTSIMAPQIIHIIAGTDYDKAIIPMRLILPAAYAVGLSQILSIQVLLPLKKDSILLVASVIGATIAIILNISIVPSMQSIGSAIVLTCSEYAVFITYITYIVKKKLLDTHIVRLSLESLIRSLPCIVICICCSYITNTFISISAAVILSVITWIIFNNDTVKIILTNKNINAK